MPFTVDAFVPAAGRAESILPLDTVKAHLAVELDVTEFDDLLALFRDAAVEEVEGRTGLLLEETPGLVWRGDFPTWGRIELARGPVVSVDSIGYLDRDGAPLALEADRFVVRRGGTWLESLWGWPTGVRAGSVEIIFTAGFAEGTCPRPLVQAALMLCGHYFLNREAVVAGSGGTELPLGVSSICDRYRGVSI